MYKTYDQIEIKLDAIEYDLTKHPNFNQLSFTDQDFIEYDFQEMIENEIRELKRASRDCHRFIRNNPESADYYTEGQSRIVAQGLIRIENLYTQGNQFIEDNT